eukprot:TRINITY_DN7798_c0_g1_i1.p3 TRINITY_DN7798_c0_g1~~TRINITY_DN7798_c0_g1_i1.p3  ORF type:complete len:104 (+),score=3.40 TRINITY_DN7798_c0_g1_i1:2-313(+)
MIESWKESLGLEVTWVKCEAMAKIQEKKKTKSQRVQARKYLGIVLTMRYKSIIRAMFKEMANKRFPRKINEGKQFRLEGRDLCYFGMTQQKSCTRCTHTWLWK